jgi:putative Mg2+ transporter-C (MgtC) family protein
MGSQSWLVGQNNGDLLHDTACGESTTISLRLRVAPRDFSSSQAAKGFAVNHWDALLDDMSRLGVAALLGGALGFEREWTGHWAGLRTHMMVSIGCAIFVIAGEIVSGDQRESMTRVIQGLATGVGFLGAGTILKLDQKQEIKGLTTASSIWLAAALGTVAGLKEYALAMAAAAVSLFVLGVLGPAEKFFERRQAIYHRERDQADREKKERKQENEPRR